MVRTSTFHSNKTAGLDQCNYCNYIPRIPTPLPRILIQIPWIPTPISLHSYPYSPHYHPYYLHSHPHSPYSLHSVPRFTILAFADSHQKSSFYVLFFLNWVIKKVRFLLLFSLLNLVKDMWTKFLSIKHSSTHKMWSKCEVQCNPDLRNKVLGNNSMKFWDFPGTS